MAEFTWYGQLIGGGTFTQISGANHTLSFYGDTFGTAISVGSYQTSMHNESGGIDHCPTTHINNCKYVSAGNIDINGDGSEALASGTAPTQGEHTMKVNFTHNTSVALSAVSFWADDGITATVPPSGLTFYAGEYGETAWSSPTGSANSMSLENKDAATSHDYYIFCSASPDQAGTMTNFRLQIELTYQ